MPSTPPIAPSEITSEAQYLMTRRTALHAAGALAIGAPSAGVHAQPQAAMHAALAATRNPMYAGPAEPLSPWDEVASYVLYHEFGGIKVSSSRCCSTWCSTRATRCRTAAR